MPLLHGKQPWQCSGAPEGCSPEQQLFCIQYTGEAFSDYAEFLARSELYRSHTWTSGYWADKHNLTLEDAMQQDCLGQSLAGKVRLSRISKKALSSTA